MPKIYWSPQLSIVGEEQNYSNEYGIFSLIKIVSTTFFNFNFFFRLAEGEMALTGGCLTNSKPLETIASEFGSAAGYGLALLGQICRFVFLSNKK